MKEEKLILELQKYILDAYKKRIDIDKNYVFNLGEIIINSWGLNNYVNRIAIKNIEQNCIGQYIIHNKIVNFDITKILNFLNSIKGLNLSWDSKNIYYYVSVLEFLLHELEHANQMKKVDDNENKLETKILASSLLYKRAYYNLNNNNPYNDLSKDEINKYFNRKFNLYTEFKSLAPEERIADYYASMVVLGVLKEFFKNEDLMMFQKNKFFRYLMVGYDETFSPTKDYLDKLNTSFLISEEELRGDKLSLNKRLALGLQISHEEKEELDNLYLQLKNKVYR